MVLKREDVTAKDAALQRWSSTGRWRLLSVPPRPLDVWASALAQLCELWGCCPTNPMICRGISLPSAESWKDWKLLLLRNVAQVAWLDFLHLLWACGIWRQEDSSKVGFSATPRHIPQGPTAGQPARFLPSKWKFQMSLCPLGHVRTTDAQEGAFIGLDVSKNRTPQAPKLILLHVKPWSVPHKLPRCRDQGAKCWWLETLWSSLILTLVSKSGLWSLMVTCRWPWAWDRRWSDNYSSAKSAVMGTYLNQFQEDLYLYIILYYYYMIILL